MIVHRRVAKLSYINGVFSQLYIDNYTCQLKSVFLKECLDIEKKGIKHWDREIYITPTYLKDWTYHDPHPLSNIFDGLLANNYSTCSQREIVANTTWH